MLFFTDFEASFIRLLDKLTNGSNIEINEAGRYQIIFEVFLPTFILFAPFLILFTCYLLFTAVKYN